MTNSQQPTETDASATDSLDPDSAPPDDPTLGDGSRATSSEQSDEEVRYRARPTIRPQLAWSALTVIVGGAIAGALFANVLGLEDRQLSVIGGMAVVFVVVAILGRLVVQMYVLRRTSYTITSSAVRYEFSLWFRTRSREVPRSKIRACQHERDRVQKVFGVGTVTVLTGGTNASLGYVEFSNVPNSEAVRDVIREQIP
ncbi:PH domain-containing protein [Natrinema salsiterrestre]|uniref:PH domain-containing protein n=1 Tax=Natrinema salsiterrestre TaxID=2950540 RepID=A0A9Q4L7Y5_9EURY|nr:PH domain-containing protein [Natrinema salsiterrestre]MDF9747620.1 PH domain-containing protein [Natrinema salsiterrestre]